MSGMRQRVEASLREHRIMGAVAGISVRGSRQFAAAGTANVTTGEPMTAVTKLHVASVTKPIVAASFLSMAGSQLDSPLINLLPELADSWRASPRVTPRDALSHSSGLQTDFPVQSLAALGAGDDALLGSARMVVSHRQVLRPRMAWQYCNGGYWLTGLALARHAGTTFERTVVRAMLDPIGMRDTGFGPVTARGHQNGQVHPGEYLRARRPGGGLCSTVGDLLSFADFLMDRPELLSVMSNPVVPTLRGSWYGIGLELSDRSGNVVWHRGHWNGHHSCLLMVPRQRFAVAAVVNDEAGQDAVSDIVAGELAGAAGQAAPWRATARWLRSGYAGSRFLVAKAAARLG